MFNRIKQIALDILFPIHCVGCHRADAWLCDNCRQHVRLQETQVCPGCRQPSLGGITHANCADKTPLAGLRVATSYAKNPSLKKAITTLKYHFSEPLATSLGQILAGIIRETSYPSRRVISYVPMHPLRLRWRGFNQGELLARAVANELDLPVEEILIKVKRTRAQARLRRKSRLDNLRNAFKLTSTADVRGKTIILVDDVASTGATLNECARVLREHGATAVWGLVIARG